MESPIDHSLIRFIIQNLLNGAYITILKFQKKRENKLWLSCAKLKLSYVEDNDEVLVKVREKVVVEAKFKLLFCRVGGWEGGQIKRN